MRKEEVEGDQIFVIHDLLTSDECEHFVALSEASGYDDAPITAPTGFLMRKDVRNNERLILDDLELARRFWQSAKPFIPTPLFDSEAIGFNERFRFYRYDVGQFFAQHIDGSFVRNPEERSELSFMIYLNDGFEGGDTIFSKGRWDAFNERWESTLRVRPKRGMALVFQHDQVHEGAPVEKGRKYVLRTDVMYRLAGAPK
jgi:predicted 2-oxoglutarate/Fe(II)-dependent dioxygenase YbiX